MCTMCVRAQHSEQSLDCSENSVNINYPLLIGTHRDHFVSVIPLNP